MLETEPFSPTAHPIGDFGAKLSAWKPGPGIALHVSPSSVEKSAPDGPTVTRVRLKPGT